MEHDMDTGAGQRRNRWSLLIWGGAAALLSVPAVAMYFGAAGVHWGPEDFIVMGILFALACGGYEVATRLSGNTAYRLGAGVAIVTCFLTVWVNLAVGMVGDEDNPANLLFGGVILLAVAGTILARFQPRGTARAMQAAALAQGVMAIYAAVAGDLVTVLPVALFILPWLLAGHLFLRAAEQGARVD